MAMERSPITTAAGSTAQAGQPVRGT